MPKANVSSTKAGRGTKAPRPGPEAAGPLPTVSTVEEAAAFLAERGIVLFSGRGAGPTLVDVIAGETVRGSWWGHPAGHRIFALASALEDNPDILWCKLLAGKRTLVHRRLWPALVRLQDELGAHRTVIEPFGQWLEAAVKKAGERLSREDAIALLPPEAWAIARG